MRINLAGYFFLESGRRVIACPLRDVKLRSDLSAHWCFRCQIWVPKKVTKNGAIAIIASAARWFATKKEDYSQGLKLSHSTAPAYPVFFHSVDVCIYCVSLCICNYSIYSSTLYPQYASQISANVQQPGHCISLLGWSCWTRPVVDRWHVWFPWSLEVTHCQKILRLCHTMLSSWS